MTTTQGTPMIAQLLRKKRGDRFMTDAAREIGVSRQMYAQWESGHAIPGDEWAERLMTYLGMAEVDVVLTLYWSRKARQDPGIDVMSTWPWFRRPIDIDVAAENLKAA